MSKQDPPELPEKLSDPTSRAQWWESLPPTWQKAFLTGYLQRQPPISITDADLLKIATTPTLRFVGPGGMYPNIEGSLKDLKPLQPLTQLQYLFITFCGLQSLEGAGNLRKLKSLFIHNNAITSLDPVSHMTELEELYCNDNQIVSLFPLQHCHKLTVVYCQANALKNLRGMTRIHTRSLQRFVCLPNDGITMAEISRVQKKIGLICSKV